MNLRVNGESRTIPTDVQSIRALLLHLNIELKCVAVELNGEILETSQFQSARLKENDKIEIVSFVGGG